jgi:hypothetical protein
LTFVTKREQALWASHGPWLKKLNHMFVIYPMARLDLGE